MRVLLDECIDWRFAREIVGHKVKTVGQMSWASFKNGELLALAAEHFDVFVTVDRNLAFQQRLTARAVAVIILHGKTNRLSDLRPLVPKILAALPSSRPGTVTHLGL